MARAVGIDLGTTDSAVAVPEGGDLLQHGDVPALRAATARLSTAATAFGTRLRQQAAPGNGATTATGGDDVIDAEVVDEGSRA